MIKLKQFIECTQDNIDMFLFTLNSSEFLDNSYVDYYKENEGSGYQRPLYRPHYRKIANYLLANENGLLPTAIIAAIDRTSIDLNENELTINRQFRVVDGQHRKEALAYLKANEEKVFNDRISKLNFPIVLMVIDKNNDQEYINEIQAFIDINKKGRKVSTDLAYTLLKRINESRLKNKEEFSDCEIYEQIAISTAVKLNHNINSCWYQEIKTGGDKDYGKAISLNAFNKSLIPFINLYCTKNYDKADTCENIERIIDQIEEIIVRLWNLIGDKWEDCFFTDDENQSYRYDRYYNIQKGIGVYPLHEILAELYDHDQNEYLELFKKCLSDSDIIDYMWRVGGEFSMFNSKSGFKEIKNKIIIWVP